MSVKQAATEVVIASDKLQSMIGMNSMLEDHGKLTYQGKEEIKQLIRDQRVQLRRKVEALDRALRDARDD